MKYRRMFQRSVCAVLALSSLAPSVSAAMKSVELWGVWSVNDKGLSDNKITMEELQEDYSGYLQTDGMTEFFHKDISPSPKIDMSEALAWLIDNDIISRDSVVTVYNTNGVPDVSITKTDIDTVLYNQVTRSDAIMYIFKSVFGPIDGRTIGVETPSVRSDNGSLYLYSDLFDKYSDYVDNEDVDDKFPGQDGSPGSGGSSGGSGGDGSTNQTNTGGYWIPWEYTPQGDEYTSMWGDTNVFISENTFNQDTTGGTGGDGGDGYSGVGGDGGSGGSASNIINYETDYKQIYFVPAADVLFYRTSDVVEVYLQAALSKGIFEGDTAAKTSKFYDVFEPLTKDESSLAAWSGEADPYIVNTNNLEHVRVESVVFSNVSDILGENYNITYTGDTVTIRRDPLFESNTGFFETEQLSRMDFYRYIYLMVSANEKKITDTEAEIVAYKYGLNLSYISSEADRNAVQFLIAKGILNYDGSNELQGLYDTVTWEDIIPVLYRVANPAARLDFSVVQLTDSETAWKAKGFYPQDTYLTVEGSTGTARFEYNEDYYLTPASEPRLSEDPLGWIASGLSYLVSPPAVLADDNNIGKLTYTVQESGAMTLGGYHFDFTGASYGSNDALLTAFKSAVENLNLCTMEELKAQSNDGINVNNPKHLLVAYFTKNIYVISRIQQDQALYNSMCNILTDYQAKLEKGSVTELQRMQITVVGYLRQHLDLARQKVGVPHSIVYIVDGVRTNTPNAGGDLADFAESISAIEFKMGNTTNSAAEDYTFEFADGDAATFITESSSTKEIILAANKSAVEFQKAVSAADLEEAGSTEELISSFTSRIGTSLNESMLYSLGVVDSATTDALASFSSTFKQFVNPDSNESFISWTDLSGLIKSSGGLIPIVKISDNLLLNTETNTYAYFSDASNGGKAVALVGAAVVSGDEDLGVVFKSGEGEAATIYYHLDAVRLLINAKQEETIIDGRRYFALADESIRNALKTIPMLSESGVSEDNITGFYALISRDANADKENFAPDSAFNQSRFVGNYAWARYFSLAQASRASNIITRKMQYTYNEVPITVFAVVRFKPVDLNNLTTAEVSSSISLQEMLNMTATPPTNSAAREVWEANKAACNVYANWIYGTSGETFIETGYLQPEATMYVLGDASKAVPPQTLYGSMSKEYRASVHIVNMVKAYAGVALDPSEVPTSDDAIDITKLSAYWLAQDAQALVSGDRIYIHEALLDGVTLTGVGESLVAQATNTVARTASFALGSSFKAKSGEIAVNTNPEIKVIETSSDGMVTAQVGPLKGFAVNTGSTVALLPYSFMLSSTPVSDLDLYSNDGDNLLKTVYFDLFKYCSTMEYLGICEDPVRDSDYTYSSVFDGTKVVSYDNSTALVKGSITLPKIEPDETCQEFIDRTKSQYSKAGLTCSTTTCYLKIRFPACDYRVIDGVLKPDTAQACDFLSPVLFVSLNDLIIDSMINESNGAIDLNDVPDGSLVKMGGTWFSPVRTDSGKTEFVGYAYLQSFVSKPTIQDAAVSFATQFVRVGNQYNNVSNYFTDFKLITAKSSEDTNALNIVVSETFTLGDTAKYSVTALGETEVITTSKEAFGGALYTPVRFSCSEGLLAYPVLSSDSGVARYNLCNTAKSSSTGLFADLPFFSDSVLDSELYSATTGIATSGFQPNARASALTDFFMQEFKNAFSGDLVNLIRFLLFIILVWIILASWVIYMCRVCNLQPFFEMIRYPSGSRESKGIDLFKLVSLGTISLDSEFGFTRFLLYNLVLMSLTSIILIAG